MIAARHIDDGEAANGKTHPLRHVEAITVGPAMRDGRVHLLQNFTISQTAVGIGQPTNSTHYLVAFSKIDWYSRATRSQPKFCSTLLREALPIFSRSPA